MKKLEELLKDTKFLEKISSASSDEEILKILNTKNIKISPQQLKEAKKIAEDLKNKSGEIIDEGPLENIVGGKWYDGVYALSKSAAYLGTAGAIVYGIYKITNNLDQITNNIGKLTESASGTMDHTSQLISTVNEKIPGAMDSAINTMDATTHLVDHVDTSMDPLLGNLPMGIGKGFKRDQK